MPVYAEIEGIGRLEFPDGTDPAVIQQTVQKVVAGGDSRVEQLRSNWAKNNPIKQIGNVQRGAIDVIGGGAQLLARGANAAGLVPESNPGSLFAGPKDVEAQNDQARANVDQWFGKAEPGINPVRMASSALLTMPLTPTKFLQAPTALGRAGGAGVAGGVSGAVQEVQNPRDNADFFKKKGIQTAVAAGAAALSQPIAEWTVKQVVAGLNTVADKAVAGAKDLTGANSIDKLVTMIRSSLRRAGIEFDDLSEATKQGLLDDVQNALKGHSSLNSGAVARQAAFKEEGQAPLRHWISRDPGEFTKLENLSHTDAGNVLKQKKADLDAFVMKRLTGMRGEGRLPEDVGKAAQADLKGYVAGEEGKTDVLYRTFREIAPDAKGNPQRFANDVFGGLEGQMAGAALPDNLRNLVNKMSSGEIPLTPDYLYQLQKMAKPGADGTTNYALGHLRKAIDRELDAISQGIGAMDRSMPVAPGTKVPDKDGQYAADVLKMARAQAKKVFHETDHNNLISLKAPGMHSEPGSMPPETFTDVLMGASLKDSASAWAKLSNEAKEGVRAQVLETLKTKAFSGASEESGKAANQATFNNFLNDKTTSQKLRMVLGDEKFGAVKRLALMLESAHMQPSGSAVNNSKTGGALLTALPRVGDWLKAKNIPGGSFVQDTAQRGMAEAAQVVPPEALARRSLVIDPLVEEILKRRAGHYSGLLGGVGGASAFQGLLGP